MNPEPTTGQQLAALIPMVIIAATFCCVILAIAPRKGRSKAVALLGLIPLANIIYMMWLCSLTDKAVLDALEELKRRNA